MRYQTAPHSDPAGLYLKRTAKEVRGRNGISRLSSLDGAGSSSYLACTLINKVAKYANRSRSSQPDAFCAGRSDAPGDPCAAEPGRGDGERDRRAVRYLPARDLAAPESA